MYKVSFNLAHQAKANIQKRRV